MFAPWIPSQVMASQQLNFKGTLNHQNWKSQVRITVPKERIPIHELGPHERVPLICLCSLLWRVMKIVQLLLCREGTLQWRYRRWGLREFGVETHAPPCPQKHTWQLAIMITELTCTHWTQLLGRIKGLLYGAWKTSTHKASRAHSARYARVHNASSHKLNIYWLLWDTVSLHRLWAAEVTWLFIYFFNLHVESN